MKVLLGKSLVEIIKKVGISPFIPFSLHNFAEGWRVWRVKFQLFHFYFFSIVIHTIPFVARMSGEGMISNAFRVCIQVFRLESSTTRLRFTQNEKYYLLLIIRYRRFRSVGRTRQKPGVTAWLRISNLCNECKKISKKVFQKFGTYVVKQ